MCLLLSPSFSSLHYCWCYSYSYYNDYHARNASIWVRPRGACPPRYIQKGHRAAALKHRAFRGHEGQHLRSSNRSAELAKPWTLSLGARGEIWVAMWRVHICVLGKAPVVSFSPVCGVGSGWRPKVVGEGETLAVYNGRDWWGRWWQRYFGGAMNSRGLFRMAKGLGPWREPATGTGRASPQPPFKLWGGRALGNLLRDVKQVTLPCGPSFCQTGYFSASQRRVLWGLSQMTGIKSTLAIVKHCVKCEVLFLLPFISLYRMWPNNWMTVSGCSRGSNKGGDGRPRVLPARASGHGLS